jgi:hypothetical protein
MERPLLGSPKQSCFDTMKRTTQTSSQFGCELQTQISKIFRLHGKMIMCGSTFFYTIVDTFLRGQASNIESGDCTHLSSLTSKLLASFCGQNRGVSTKCQTHLQS